MESSRNRRQFLGWGIAASMVPVIFAGCASPGSSAAPRALTDARTSGSTSATASQIAAVQTASGAGGSLGAVAGSATRGIVVNGTGTVSARPDRAIVTAGVETQGTTAQQAHDENGRAMQAVVDAIKGLGIPAAKIQTSGISLDPVYAEGQSITGYRASNLVTVTVDEVDSAGKVLDTAVGAGANTAGNVRFSLKDSTTLRNQALTAAVADATAKADVLAKAIGITRPGIVSVSEGGVSAVSPEAAKGLGAADAGVGVPVEPGLVTVTAQVTVRFGQ